ncbi:PREDICTED: homeobox protein HOX1A-like isoform X2 [Ipomoea nil]|uniref:homeobox protein HOX1A-like isoform X2 n=1 Tax=Ipomoea nil TaxID=35883 RepID=UPI0009009CEC|nr:PREDICTED: homeobox protein HOX1A-like isoform X2 [Ipomoea nil]
MTETVHSGTGESNVKCYDPESVERLTLSDTIPKNSNCESLGENAIEFEYQNRDSEPLGQTMAIRNGNVESKPAETRVAEFELVGELSPNYISVDSNKEEKRPEFKDCRENSKTEQIKFPFGNEATSSKVEYSAEPLQVMPAKYVSMDSNNEQKIPSLQDCGQNSKIEDNVGTSSTIESAIEPPKELPTENIFTDSNLEQKNLPLKNCGFHSNLVMALPSENKDNNFPVQYPAEPPNDVIKNHDFEQLNETQKDAVEIPSEPLVQKSENDENLGERTIVESVCNEVLLPSGDVAVNSSLEQKESAPEDLTVDSSFKNLELLHENEEAISIVDRLAELHGDASENPGQDLSKMPRDSNENATQLECGDKRPTGCSRKRKATLGSPVISTRVLRSRTQEEPKPVEPIHASANDSATDEKKRKRRKRKHSKQIAVNEFSGIKSHLRYLLSRIKYEQNLIDAYSAEGWKGQSLEKLKPEKELQRAKSGIFHYKLKIRDLFQRIDTSLSQGKLPESLFDSEGQIDSEDIFCAKCGSTDLPADNDIILCDGACERGFHQLCLEPPLLKEDIPPGDEGWLCPGCDCKVDCTDLLSDLLGTDLSVTDSWEKVFPEEAAAAASGKQLDDISGLPSDGSDDDDYNPDNPEVEENVSQDESSSDENDSSDASFDLETTANDDILLGLPSEDSEDDDFDPDAPDHDEQVMQESSSSGFTSDSEDSGQDQCEKIKVGGAKQQPLKDEVSYLLHSSTVLASGKRQVERLDYKKLHDETYGIASSDSSDEDYEDNSPPKRRKKGSDKAGLKSSDQSPLDAMDKNFKQNEIEHTANRRASKKFNGEGLVVSESGSSGKRNSRFGEDAIKRLNEAFKENHYPKRNVKESLARELGLTLRQVDKWFGNSRWSFYHPSASRKEPIASETPPKSGISLPQMEEATPDVQECLNGDMKLLQPETKETDVLKHTTPESKTTSNADDQASNQSSKTQRSKKRNTQVDIANSQRARRSNR